MTRRLLNDCLLTIVAITFSLNCAADSIPLHDPVSVILKDRISVSIGVSFTDNVADYPVILLEVTKGQAQIMTLMVDYGAESNLAFYIMGNGILHKVIPGFNVNNETSAEITATITSTPDMISLKLADTTITVEGLGFNRGDRYSVSNIPEATEANAIGGKPAIKIVSFSVSDTSSDRMNYTEIFLLLLLVVADIVFFIVIHLRNKYLQRKNRHDQALSIMIRNEKISEKVQMKISSVNMFGGFEIYNRNGESITSNFSPLLKELFLLLICRQPEEGITSSSLKDILWFDKNEENARNNRSVYFARLRQILDTLGVYVLANRSGKWTIDFEDIYVDFLEYNKIVRQETIGESDVTKLVSIIRKGPLLPECNYSWLDEVKAAVADYSITILSDYSDQLDKKMYPELLNSIADALFTVDPLNDLALAFKCRYYNGMGKVFLSKQLYTNYIKDYRNLYGEEYNKSYMEVISEPN